MNLVFFTWVKDAAALFTDDIGLVMFRQNWVEFQAFLIRTNTEFHVQASMAVNYIRLFRLHFHAYVCKLRKIFAIVYISLQSGQLATWSQYSFSSGSEQSISPLGGCFNPSGFCSRYSSHSDMAIGQPGGSSSDPPEIDSYAMYFRERRNPSGCFAKFDAPKLRLPSTFTRSLSVGDLIAHPNVGKAEKDLAGAVAAQLSAERAVDDDVVSREGLLAGGNVPVTAFAIDDVVSRLDAALLAIAHRHGKSLGRNKGESLIA